MRASRKTLHHLERIEDDMCRRFPYLSREQVDRHMTEIADELLRSAHFDDYVPLLAARRARDVLTHGA